MYNGWRSPALRNSDARLMLAEDSQQDQVPPRQRWPNRRADANVGLANKILGPNLTSFSLRLRIRVRDCRRTPSSASSMPSIRRSRGAGDGVVDLPLDHRSARWSLVGDRQSVRWRNFLLHNACPFRQRVVITARTLISDVARAQPRRDVRRHRDACTQTQARSHRIGTSSARRQAIPSCTAGSSLSPTFAD